jgi:hypothetical protein
MLQPVLTPPLGCHHKSRSKVQFFPRISRVRLAGGSESGFLPAGKSILIHLDLAEGITVL